MWERMVAVRDAGLGRTMLQSERWTGTGSGAARGVLLAGLTAAALAVFLGLFVGLGVLQIVRDQAVADAHAGGSAAQPSTQPDANLADEPATDQTGPTQMAPASRPAYAPTAQNTPALLDAPAAEPPPAPVAPAAAVRQASASLLGVDDHSRGGWVGRYGKRGYSVAMAGSTPRLPPGVELTTDRGQLYIWSPVTTDPRGLSVPETPSRLSAGQWFAWDHFSLDLDLRRGTRQDYQVALYLMDWDSDARVQQLEVADAESGGVLFTRTDEHFRSGRYVILRLSGHVVLRFTRTGGANCTLSGVFLDDPPPAA